jgi:hypothetical protein
MESLLSISTTWQYSIGYVNKASTLLINIEDCFWKESAHVIIFESAHNLGNLGGSDVLIHKNIDEFLFFI